MDFYDDSIYSELKPKYGNINFRYMQDLELVAIVTKELRFLLRDIYRCKQDESLLRQVQRFCNTDYSTLHHISRSKRLSLDSYLKAIVHERNSVIHCEGLDFLNDRTSYINQCRELFEYLSPKTKESMCISPSRRSQSIPTPSTMSMLEDITFIDYPQYEDLTLAIKVIKRIDHILREVFRVSGEELLDKVNSFPYDAKMKRKMLQICSICDRMITHERFSNNFENRVEFVNLVQSVLTGLKSLQNTSTYPQLNYNITHDLDVLSNNSTEAIPMTNVMSPASSTVSRIDNITSPNMSLRHYEILPLADETVTLNFDGFSNLETSTRKDEMEFRRRNELQRRKLAQIKEDKSERKTRRLMKVCGGVCCGIVVMVLVCLGLYMGVTYFF